jgi:hypothetical protein
MNSFLLPVWSYNVQTNSTFNPELIFVLKNINFWGNLCSRNCFPLIKVEHSGSSHRLCVIRRKCVEGKPTNYPNNLFYFVTRPIFQVCHLSSQVSIKFSSLDPGEVKISWILTLWNRIHLLGI